MLDYLSKEEDVPTVFPIVEAMLMSSIRRIRSPNAVSDTGRSRSGRRQEGLANGLHVTVSAIFYFLT